MGVRLLTFSAAATAADTLHARLDALGAERAGRWRTQAVLQHPRDAGSSGSKLSNLFMLTFGEAPHAHYMVTGSVVVEAGHEIVGVIEAARTHAQRLKVTAEGGVFRCGDMTVRLGHLFLNENLSGTCCEVEYAPCAAVVGGAGLLREFSELLLPPEERDFCSEDAACLQAAFPALPAQCGWEHAACQFVGLMRARLLTEGQTWVDGGRKKVSGLKRQRG